MLECSGSPVLSLSSGTCQGCCYCEGRPWLSPAARLNINLSEATQDSERSRISCDAA